MKADQARKIADTALEQLAAALKRGKSQELTRYLAMLARFHRYSFGNVLMIVAQRPDSTHVAGFNTWKSLGRFVKKGEKGIVILAPMLVRDKAEEPKAGEERQSVLRFRAVYIFDVTQTEGEPLAEPARVDGDPGHYLDRLHSVIAERGITLDRTGVPAGALGASHGGRISLREGLPAAEEFSVLTHELAHELLHRGEDRPSSKTVRETEAEAVAFVVCQAIGLNTGTAASDYIQLYSGDTDTLAASLDRVQKVAAAIIAGIEGAEEHATDA